MMGKKKQMSHHHRRCRSNGGNDHPSNISLVSDRQHAHWHGLFSNMKPDEIADRINEVWLDARFVFIVKVR